MHDLSPFIPTEKRYCKRCQRKRITVFNSPGHIIFEGRGESHEQELMAEAKDICIVQISGKSLKLNVK